MPTPQKSYYKPRKTFRFSSSYRSVRGLNEEGKAPIPVEEKPLLYTFALLLVVMPWTSGIGSQWTPFIGLTIAAACFILAGSARNSTKQRAHLEGQSPTGRLIRFPAFYLGLGFIAYIAAQWLNPAVVISAAGTHPVTFEPIEHIRWLPSGSVLPDGERGALAFLPLIGTPFLAVCAAWMGITRRRSVLFLCRVLCVNAFLLAVLGLAQIFLGAGSLLSLIHSEGNSLFFGAFPHKAQAVAYLNLMMGVTAGMSLHAYYESRRRIERSSSSGVFLSFTIILFISVLFSFSRLGYLAGTTLILSLAAAFIYPLFIERSSEVKRTAFPFLAPLIILLGAYLLSNSVLEPMSRHFNHAPASLSPAGQPAGEGPSAAELFTENKLFGWGPGSLQAITARTSEAINGELPAEEDAPDFPSGDLRGDNPEKPLKGLYTIPFEFGIAGTVLLALLLAFLIWQLTQFRVWRHPLASFILLSSLLTLFHSGIEPLMRAPALLTSWCLLLAITLILLRTERLSRRHS